MSQIQTVTGQQNTDRALDRLRRLFRNAIDARGNILQILEEAPDDANRLRVAEENFETVRRRLDREAELLSSFALEGATVEQGDINDLKTFFQRAMDDIERDLFVDDAGRVAETTSVREAIDNAENQLREKIIKANETPAAGVRAAEQTTQEELDNLRSEQGDLQQDVNALRAEPQLGLQGIEQLAAKVEQLRLITDAINSLAAAETGVQTPEQLNERRGAFIRRMTELRALFTNAIAAGRVADARTALADAQNELRTFAAFLADAQESLTTAGIREAFLDTFNRETETLGPLEQQLLDAGEEPQPAPNGEQSFLQEMDRVIAETPEAQAEEAAAAAIRDLFARARALGITDDQVASAVLGLIPGFPSPFQFSNVESAILIQVLDRLVEEREPLRPAEPTPTNEEDAKAEILEDTLSLSMGNIISLGDATRAAIAVKDRQTGQENFSRWSEQLIVLGRLTFDNAGQLQQQQLLAGAQALLKGAVEVQRAFQAELIELAQAGLGEICISEQIVVEGAPKEITICAKPGIGLPDFNQTQFFREVRAFQRRLAERDRVPEPEPIAPDDGFEPGDPRGFQRPVRAPAAGARP